MEKSNQPDTTKHDGSEALIRKYNINDQAHSDSSASDFVKTVSEFHHADESKDVPNDNQSDSI